MTREFKLHLQNVSGKVISNPLLTLVAALGTHLLDVIAVKDRVESIRIEQIENTKFRITSGEEIKQLREQNLTIIHGQWVINKRLCVFLVAHGEGDAECTSALWEDHVMSRQ